MSAGRLAAVPPRPAEPSRAEIRRSLRIIKQATYPIEIRLLGGRRGTVSAYCDDEHLDVLADEVAKRSPTVEGCYVMLNPVIPEVQARANNRFVEYAKRTTGDREIVHRYWLPIDFDAKRPAGISATADEHQAALDLAHKVRDSLTQLGWPAPITGDSGNGGHLLYAVDLPNDAAATAPVKAVLGKLDKQFSTESVAIDTTCYNAARIWKIYGTIARKGDSTPDRPHRVARLLDVPDELRSVPREMLEAYAAVGESASDSGAKSATRSRQPTSFDLDRYITEHNIQVKRREPYEGGERIILENCVFDAAHGGTSAAIIQLVNGALAYKCQHNGCADRKWADVRNLFEPENRIDGIRNGYFQFLGYDHGSYFFFSRRTRQIVSLDIKSLSNRDCLKQLAPLSFWEMNFPGRSSWDTEAASEFLQSGSCATKCIFKPDVVRGRGAWQDDDRLILHLGDRLLVDGTGVSIDDWQFQAQSGKRRFCYDATHGIEIGPPCDLLTTEQGAKLTDLAAEFLWMNPLSARLLLGWIVVAPLCGTLQWRPHIWLTGPAGSGKGTVLNYFVKPLMPFRFPSDFTSMSTEAGIRQSLKLDALPVVYDEAESEDDAGRARVRRLLGMIRASSSATEKMAKGTTTGKPMQFEMRSSFLLSSINVLVDKSADRRRIGVLDLRKSEDPAQWDTLKKKLEFVTPDLGHALFARTVALYDVLRQDIARFRDHIGKHLGDTTAGDQYGPLLAGAHLLSHDEPVSPIDAYDMLCEFDWREFGLPEKTERDERQCLASILGAIVTAEGHKEGRTISERRTIGELIQLARGKELCSALTHEEAGRCLPRYGVRAEPGEIWIANRAEELGKLLKGQAWGGTTWRNYLKRLPGATTSAKPKFFAGAMHQYVILPLALLEELGGGDESR